MSVGMHAPPILKFMCIDHINIAEPSRSNLYYYVRFALSLSLRLRMQIEALQGCRSRQKENNYQTSGADGFWLEMDVHTRP